MMRAPASQSTSLIMVQFLGWVADRPQLLLKFAPRFGLEITDPFGGPSNGYEEALDLIEAGCKGLLAALTPLTEKAS